MAVGRGKTAGPTTRFQNVSECVARQIPTDPNRSPQIHTDPRRPPLIPTILVRGSAVHHRPLSSLYQDGIIVSHLVGPVALTQTRSPKMSQDGTEWNCRPVRSSLLGSVPVGPPGPPDSCEHWLRSGALNSWYPKRCRKAFPSSGGVVFQQYWTLPYWEWLIPYCKLAFREWCVKKIFCTERFGAEQWCLIAGACVAETADKLIPLPRAGPWLATAGVWGMAGQNI